MKLMRAFGISSIAAAVSFFVYVVPADAAGASGSSATDAKPSTLLKKSYDQMLEGEFRDAVDTQILAVKADKDNVSARRYLSYSLLKIGASDEAIDQLHCLLSMTKATPLDMCMCGEALYQAGRYSQSELWFKEALEADPNLTSAKVGLSNVASARKRRSTTPGASAPRQGEESADEAGAAPKTTYEQGQIASEDLNQSFPAVPIQSNQNTQSLASDTAQRLRTNPQVASVIQPPGGEGEKPARGAASQGLSNNQIHNAWQGYKGVQKH